MRVALTGVAGFLGSNIAGMLVQAGHQVTGLVRKTSRRNHVEPFVDRFVVGDQADEACWPEFLEGADCVIHNSFDWELLRQAQRISEHLDRNLCGSIRLMKTAAPRQFIFISTIAVHHDMSARWQGRVDEDHPLRPGSWYGAYKAAVEAHLWAAFYSDHQPTCAMRPCGVYGIDRRIERSYGYDILRKIRNDQPIRKLGGGKFIHVEDVAEAVTAAVGNEETDGRAFNLVDCYARWADWALMACRILGIEVEVDTSSPTAPANEFVTDAAESVLGVSLNRGHEGINDYLGELVLLTSK